MTSADRHVYVMLPRWQSNRVFGAASLQLAQAEVDFVSASLFGEAITGTAVIELGALEYLQFERRGGPLTDIERTVLSNVSLLHALYERREGALLPVEVGRRAMVDDDVVTIQRYTGKTNEQFTHLLVNLALAAAGASFSRMLAGETVRLLDPVCGRGTTLNHAVLYGIDALGVEADRRDVEAYEHFILTWLKDKRMKHTAERSKIRKGAASGAQTFRVTYRPAKQAPPRLIEVVRDDTVNAPTHFAKKSVDVLVADLPYGVQHEARADHGFSRRPDALLEAALPAWTQVLRRGGAMALAWNLKTFPRDKMVSMLADAGLTVRMAPDDDSFVHRVDRSITRDAIVATL